MNGHAVRHMRIAQVSGQGDVFQHVNRMQVDDVRAMVEELANERRGGLLHAPRQPRSSRSSDDGSTARP